MEGVNIGKVLQNQEKFLQSRWTKGKRYKKYHYTIKDLSDLTKLSIRRIRYIFNKNGWKLDNLLDVAEFLYIELYMSTVDKPDKKKILKEVYG